MVAKKDKDKQESKVDRNSDLQKVLDSISQDYGEEAIRKGFNAGSLICEVIPTGVISIDCALGVGGFPKGRMIEVFGPESSGKTTLALTVVANAQRAGGVAAYIDAEHAIDPGWAQKIGVNLDNLYFSQPDSAEQALTICERLVLSNKVDVIVVDSVAALTPQSELDGEIGDPKQRAAQAQLLGTAMRKLKGIVRKSKACLIFINQLRASMATAPGASPDTTPGGRALKFYASIRVDIRRVGTNRVGAERLATSNATKIKVVKNKVAPPFREAEFIIAFDRGISVAESLLNTGVIEGIIKKSGSFYSYDNVKLGNGIEQAIKYLDEHPETLNAINTILRERLLNAPAGVPSESKSTDGESDGVETE